MEEFYIEAVSEAKKHAEHREPEAFCEKRDGASFAHFGFAIGQRG